MNNTEQILRDQINFWLHKNYKYFKGKTEVYLRPTSNNFKGFDLVCNLKLSFDSDLKEPKTNIDMNILIEKIDEALRAHLTEENINDRFYIFDNTYKFKKNENKLIIIKFGSIKNVKIKA